MSSGSSGVAEFIGVRPGVGWVRPRSLRKFGCALVVVGFILGRWVHFGGPWVSSDSSVAAEFIGVRPGSVRVHRKPLGSF